MSSNVESSIQSYTINQQDFTIKLSQKHANQDFDIFYLETSDDYQCYFYATVYKVWNITCPFLLDPARYELNIKSKVVSLDSKGLASRKYNNTMIVIDNTPFPNGIKSKYCA